MLRKSLSIFSLVVIMCSYSFCQDTLYHEEYEQAEQIASGSNTIFDSIKSGIVGGNVSLFSQYLDSQTFLNLSNSAVGYYSSNQAVYVLQNFINNYQNTKFNYSEIQLNNKNPYAVGVYKYYYKGEKDSANVFISLKKIRNEWKIKQITIN